MSSYPKTIKATALALLAATVTAGTIPTHLQNLARMAIQARDPPAALPQAATDDQLRWQPSLDFDTDGCYNTPAIDADGNGTYKRVQKYPFLQCYMLMNCLSCRGT